MAAPLSQPGAPPVAHHGYTLGRLLVRLTLLTCCLGLASWYFVQATSWGEIRGVLEGLSTFALVAILALTLVNLASYWVVLAASIPHLGLQRSAAVHLPATALSNTLPAGGALGTGLMVQRLRSWRFSGVTISSALVVNGVLGMVAKLSVAMVALLALTPAGDGDLRVMVLVAAVTCTLVGCTTALLRSQRFPLIVGGWLDAGLRRARRTFSRLPPINLRNVALRFQENTRGLIRDRGLMLVAATVASHATLFALFVVCFRAVGMSAADVSTVELLVAFGLSRIITVVSLTPGGIGLVEVSLAATFTAMGEPPHEAIAGVLLFRSATYIVPTLGGLLVLAAGFVVRRRSATYSNAISSDAISSDAPRPDSTTPRPDVVLQSDATPAATQPVNRAPASVP